MTNSLKLLSERRSAKRFLSDFKITNEQITELLESARMAPSSFGMEPFRVLFIKNEALRQELLSPWWNQVGVTTASGLMIWLTPQKTVIETEVIDEENKQNIPDGFEGIRQAMTDGLKSVWGAHNLTPEQWAFRQAYISLGTTLNTAQELGLDVCPSEGFDPTAVMKVLAAHNLADGQRETVAVGMFVGKVDTNQEFHHFFNKTRKPAKKAYEIVE